jgi:Galactose-3-O-sulfotransferase
MLPKHIYSKWRVPVFLLLASYAERFLMKYMLQHETCRDDDLRAQAAAIAAFPQRIWRKPNNTAIPVFTELDDVETAILGGIDLHLQRKYGKAQTRSTRQIMQPFKWTFVREPSERAQAEFLRIGGAKGQVQPFIKNLRQYTLLEDHLKQYSLGTLDPTFDNNKTFFKNVVVGILEEYHFIGVVERLEESLVVLKLLLDLEWRDILFLPTNDIFAINGTTNCVFHIPMFTRIFFLNNKTWKRRVNGDESLHQAAERSLDLTINNLGRSVIEEQVQRLRELLQLAQDKCFESTTFACSVNGDRNLLNDCFQDDKGCGYACLDTLAEQ